MFPTDDHCGVFGYSCAHGEGWILPSTRSQQIGWRPALDRPSMELCRANIGKMISFGCDGMVYKGELADFSDYDLLVDFINPMPVLELGHAVQTDDLSFVFDRAQLDFIHEL